jgi:hypothetical protein
VAKRGEAREVFVGGAFANVRTGNGGGTTYVEEPLEFRDWNDRQT